MSITISGENNNDRILAADGVIDQISGINFSGIITASHINVGSNIQLGNAGIITATTFIGNLTGNVNSTSNLLLQIGGSEKFRVGSSGQFGIAGANYGSSGQVFTSGGSGSAPSWVTPAVTGFTNGSNNRVVTATSGSGLNAESNLTYDGNSLFASGNITAASDGNRATQGNVALIVRHSTNAAMRANHFIHDDFPTGSATYYIQATESGVTNDRNLALQGYGGKVKIGSGGIEPVETLDVSGNVKATSINLANTIFHTGDTDTLIAFTTDTIKFETAGDERLRIDSSGRIGVGAVPTAQFAHNLIQIGHQATLGANAALSTTGQTFLTHNLYFDTGGTLKVFNTSNANEGAILRLVDGNLLFSNSPATTGTPTVTERFRIASNGNVSVGNNPTVHADTIFHIEDSGETNVKVEGSTSTLGARISLQNNDTTANAYSQYAFNDAGGQSTSAIQGINTDQTNNYGEMAFLTRNAQGSPPAERMRITKDGYIHLGNTAHGTNKVGGQAITGQDLDAVFKLYSSNSNLWLAQLRGDNTTVNGVFLRSGNSSSNYTLYATGYDENNPHLIVRGDGAVLIGESTQSGMQRGDVVVHASIQSGNANEPSVIHRNSSGAIIYFEYYFQCTKGGGGNSHTVNQDIIQISNIGNFHQAVFHCWMGVRLQGQGDNYTRPATWQTGVNRFNGGSTIQKEENWISADSQVQTYANLHVGNANSTSYYVRMNWTSGTYGSSFAGGKIIGSFLACDVANNNITFAYGRT